MTHLKTALFTLAFVAASGPVHLAKAQDNCPMWHQEHSRLDEFARRCRLDSDRWNEEARRLAPQGIMPPQPACMSSMPEVVTRLYYVEAQIGHCQGDQRPLCEQQGYPPGCERYPTR